MLEEYINSVKKVNSSRHHRVTHSYGMKEAYAYFRKHRKDIDSTTFRRVVQLINSLLQEQLSNGEDVHLPQRMGYLEVRKFDTKVEFRDGKMVTNLPIDWDRTLKLWYENKEAEKKKIKVRLETPTIYRVLYKKSNATYKNKAFYEFSTNRELKQALKRNILANKIDAFTFKRY